MDVGQDEHEVTLRDGTRARIRPIRPDDKQRLSEGLKLLSPRSRYMRFHAPLERLSEQQLRYLTEIDYHNHMAWVALNPDDPDEPGMGVARYVRFADEPAVAEAAITVVDRYQGRGLGTVLLGLLAASAVENGIDTLRHYVLAENTAMLEIFDHLGVERVDEGDGVYRIDMPLPVEPDARGSGAPTQVLRESARGTLPSLRWAFPWAGTLKHRARPDAAHDTDAPGPARPP